ncbi:MAG TPA: hypothetical protein DIV86_07190 [Alphaproteobacteria bacterium]|nr:hypothetical protein [Alphaproteobacteria bacterium]
MLHSKTLAELSQAYFGEQYASRDLERQFWDFNSGVGIFPRGTLDGREVVTFSSNDYLGLATNERFVNQAIEVVKARGIGSGGSHNLGGRYPELSELEHQIASVYEREGSVIFGSGYDANMETLKMLAKVYDNRLVFVSDQLNHRSIIEGMRGLPKAIFAHNDMEDLERELRKVKTTYPNSKPIIVFEGIYSMDGAMPNIKDVVALAKKYDALTIDDEVHAVGLYGSRGGGDM